MIKRVFLFLVTNLAVVALLSIVTSLISAGFGIQIGAGSYTGLMIFALIFGFGGAFISLLMSKQSAKFMMKIQLIDDTKMLDRKQQLVYQTVKSIAQENSIKMPEVGIYNSMEPNAFATGPSKNNSLVAVSTGLLDGMNPDEIQGVMAHEMAHILNGDMVTMTLLQGVLNTFVIFIARVIAMAVDSIMNSDSEGNSGSGFVYYIVSFILEIIFGIFASIIVMAFSRHREFRADEGSAKFVGVDKMISSLRALQQMTSRVISDDSSKLATMKINTKNKSGFAKLFSTHPELSERIKNLQTL